MRFFQKFSGIPRNLSGISSGNPQVIPPVRFFGTLKGFLQKTLKGFFQEPFKGFIQENLKGFLDKERFLQKSFQGFLQEFNQGFLLRFHLGFFLKLLQKSLLELHKIFSPKTPPGIPLGISSAIPPRISAGIDTGISTDIPAAISPERVFWWILQKLFLQEVWNFFNNFSRDKWINYAAIFFSVIFLQVFPEIPTNIHLEFFFQGLLLPRSSSWDSSGDTPRLSSRDSSSFFFRQFFKLYPGIPLRISPVLLTKLFLSSDFSRNNSEKLYKKFCIDFSRNASLNYERNSS